MNTTSSPSRGRSLCRLAASAALAIALAGNGWAQDTTPHSAARLQLASVSVIDLEHSFWVCDYVATARGVTEDLIVQCVAIYDELKDRKFGGDFDRLWAWWQQHKVARHAELALD